MKEKKKVKFPDLFLFLVPKVDLGAVVSPAAELHDAGLLVKRKVLDVHFAGGVVDGCKGFRCTRLIP